MISLILLVVVSLLAARSECLESNLTKIDTQPCVGIISEAVSQFSSDIFVVAPNFSLCSDDSWQLGAYNVRTNEWHNALAMPVCTHS